MESFEHCVVEGDVDAMSYIVYYLNKKDEITGVLNVEKGAITSAVAELMQMNKMPTGSQVIMGLVNGEKIMQRLKDINSGKEVGY